MTAKPISSCIAKLRAISDSPLISSSVFTLSTATVGEMSRSAARTLEATVAGGAVERTTRCFEKARACHSGR